MESSWITDQVAIGPQHSRGQSSRSQDEIGLGIYHAYLMSYSQFPAPRRTCFCCFFWMGWWDFFCHKVTKKRRSQVPEAKHFTQQQLHVVEFSCLLLLVVRSHAAKGEELWRSSLFMLVVLKAVFWPWLHFLSSDCMLGHLDFPNVLWNTESPLHKRCFLIFFAHVYIIYVCMCVWKATFVFSVLFDMFLFPKSRMPETIRLSCLRKPVPWIWPNAWIQEWSSRILVFNGNLCFPRLEFRTWNAWSWCQQNHCRFLKTCIRNA